MKVEIDGRGEGSASTKGSRRDQEKEPGSLTERRYWRRDGKLQGEKEK